MTYIDSERQQDVCRVAHPRPEAVHRAQELRVSQARHLHGGAARQGKDVHLKEAQQVPQLDRDQHQGVQRGQLQEEGHHHKLPEP